MGYNRGFWEMLDGLVAGARIVIDRPAGARHPRYPDLIYPVDYGYLEGTTGGDGAGVDLWRGTGQGGVVGIISTVDPDKRDVEVKILYNCTPEEIAVIHKLLNTGMGGLLQFRPADGAPAC